MRLNGMMAGGAPPGDGDDDNIFTRDRAPSTSETRVRQGVMLAIALGVVAMVWLYLQGGENRALNAMAPAQRAAFFQETRDDLRLTCLTDAGVTRKLEQRCRKLADFLGRFPECDEACRRELALVMPGAPR
jgi:hypothetical protein